MEKRNVDFGGGGGVETERGLELRMIYPLDATIVCAKT